MARRPSMKNVIVIALCAIATMLTAFVGRPTQSFASHGQESVAPLKARITSVSRLDRGAPIVERRVANAGDGSPGVALPIFATASALPSIAPLEQNELSPFTWIAWKSPTRARADLMVFLN